MSLILKGIDLPKEDEWLEVIIKPTKEVIVDTIRYRDNALLKTEYGSVIQIPKDHGRLIDGDEYLKAMRPRGISNEVWEESETCKSILNAPTILEAEGEEMSLRY